MGELAIDSGNADVKKEVQVSVVEEDKKDKAESGKLGANRILRYAEV